MPAPAAARNLVLTRSAAMAALFLFAVALCSEAARAFGYTDSTPRVVRASFVLFTLLAVGAAVVEHYIAATHELRRLNAELERRLAEKAEEARSTCARIEEVKREWERASERQRILADMHDGLGSSLVGLLHYVQSVQPDRATIERRVREALLEMRMAADALRPHEGDLDTVLGNLRYRLDETLRGSGMRFEWNVEMLPPVADMNPAVVLSIQRILLEAITNALKHSGAKCVRITASGRDGRGIELRIADDGRGFHATRRSSGLGLASMRARAARINAGLDIESSPGHGTTVRLRLNRGHAPCPSASPSPPIFVGGENRLAAP